ncbi:MAG: sulfatase-like hydrolase/transferase, partial [Planctomycetota bacterium]
PNIVFVLLDDVGYGDPGFHGGTNRTPHLDSLAERSLDLRCHYVAQSCSPTRMAFLTGRYPVRLGEVGLAGPMRQLEKRGLPSELVLLPARLREAGYATALVGKWHVGHHLPEHRPLQRGFDSFFGCLHNLSSYTTRVYRNGKPGWYRGEELEAVEGHTTDVIADEAVRLISQAGSSQPLFLQVAFTAVHFPLQPRPQDAELFQRYPQEEERNYVALLYHLDEAVGRIASAIAESERAEETLLIVTSDNGGDNAGYVSNGPFQGAKGRGGEGGLRAVTLCHWPAVLGSGVVDETISIVDWYPTLTALAGLEPIPGLDGLDIRDRLTWRSSGPRGDLLLMAKDSLRVLRRGPWKLMSDK